MSPDNATSLPKPKRKLGRLGIAGIVILAIVLIFVVSGIYSSVQKQQWTANSGSRTVEVTGTLAGEGWSIADTGRLKTNAQYSEMSFLVHVSRVGDTSRNTPTFTAIVGDDNGGENTCETFRSYIWSTDAGSEMEVSCDYNLTLEELKKVHTVEITGAN